MRARASGLLLVALVVGFIAEADEPNRATSNETSATPLSLPGAKPPPFRRVLGSTTDSDLAQRRIEAERFRKITFDRSLDVQEPPHEAVVQIRERIEKANVEPSARVERFRSLTESYPVVIVKWWARIVEVSPRDGATLVRIHVRAVLNTSMNPTSYAIETYLISPGGVQYVESEFHPGIVTF
jgi:hypothetical protein